MHNPSALPSHYREWEDYAAGMYGNRLNPEMVEEAVLILENPRLFEKVLQDALIQWPNAAKQHLSDFCKNHQPWCGRMACSYEAGATIKEVNQAWTFLTCEQRERANQIADRITYRWRTETLGGQSELAL